MRLINVHTMELEEYFDEEIPPYAILSHTWGKEEVSFQEWTSLFRHRKLEKRFGKSIEYMFAGLELDTIHERSGYSKIVRCAEEARSNSINYIWVDTCCIDKTSSAELSEAINSMFRWYEKSIICYAYLSDVASLGSLRHEDSDFRKSRWFTRGWTLQELLAPSQLVFFDQGWGTSCKKTHISEVISEITGISAIYISHAGFQRASFAQKMAWASQRKTTRREDLAYCLLGNFEVNIPLLYGEGDKAFTRLQEEIVKQTQDQSVFAWGFNLTPSRGYSGIFARSPDDFEGCRSVVSRMDYSLSVPSQMTNKGLQIRFQVWSNKACLDFVYGGIECTDDIGGIGTLIIPLIPLQNKSVGDGDVFWRPPNSIPIRISSGSHSHSRSVHLDHYPRLPKTWKYKLITLYLMRDMDFVEFASPVPRPLRMNFTIKGIPSLHPSTLLEIFPHTCRLEGTQIYRYQPYGKREIDRVFLRFSSHQDQVDSVVVFQYQYRYGDYEMESNILCWEQINAHRQDKAKKIISCVISSSGTAAVMWKWDNQDRLYILYFIIVYHSLALANDLSMCTKLPYYATATK
ncbi:HET-domain-containing protein [Stipitochalara longipes BDJ]|nr:HET-domain-containing protein [Stipitochalara longipes BDJ]